MQIRRAELGGPMDCATEHCTAACCAGEQDQVISRQTESTAAPHRCSEGSLRFCVGDRVSCKANSDTWTGIIVAVNVGGDTGQEDPYLVECEETATLIRVPQDTEEICQLLEPAWWVPLFRDRMPATKATFDWPGQYLVVANTFVSSEADRRIAKEVADLHVPSFVDVIEVQTIADRVRGRVAQPEGWISLRSVDDAKVFAVPRHSAHARLFRRANPGLFAEVEEPDKIYPVEPCSHDLQRSGANADPDQLDEHGCRALALALERSWLATVKTLLDLRADPNRADSSSSKRPLHQAISVGVDCVCALILARADPNLKDADPISASGQTSRAFRGDGDHRTPLHYCAEANNLEVAVALLDGRADANAVDAECTSALHLAIEEENMDIVEVLLQHDADVNLRKNRSGLSALMQSVVVNNCQLARLVISHRAQLDLQEKQGMTALHLAVRSRRGAIVRLLVEARCDPDVKAGGLTVKELAAKNGMDGIAELLCC